MGRWVACKGGACRGLLAVERVSRGGVVYVTVVRVCGRQLAMADTHSIHLEHTIKRHRVEVHEIEDSISRAYSAFMKLEDKTEGRSRLDFMTIRHALEPKSSVSYNFTGILTPPIALFLK